MEKNQILQECLSQLNNFTRDRKKLASNEAVYSCSKPDEADHDNLITISNTESGLTYTAFIQPWLPQKDISSLITRIRSMPSNVILFADFVNPVMSEKLRHRSISFVDCAGNLFLKEENSCYVKGKKPSRLRAKRVRGRAFNTAGLKLIYAIFNQPELLYATYREISKTVNIALGSVGPVMDDLHTSGYILDDGQRRLVNKKRLFERWVDGYLEKLRPSQILACYSCNDINWWKNAEPAKFGGMWGGEVTIAKATPFMVPESVTLYFSSHEDHNNFICYYGLQKDDDGEICIYKTFWPDQTSSEGVISPMIMYADIVDAINPGNWDVAKTFYGDAVAHLLND